jgi:hypothetical protein
VIRQCDYCGETYRAIRPTSRFCSSRCRSRNDGAPPSATLSRGDATDANPAVDDAAPDANGGGVVEAAERELAALGTLDTAVGNAALVFARVMADPGESASGRAAAGRQFAAFMGMARREARSDRDELDVIKARVARKRLELIVDSDAKRAE